MWWPANKDGYWLNVDSLLGDIALAEKWHIPPWEVGDRDEQIWKKVYRYLEYLVSETRFRRDVKEQLKQEEELKKLDK